MTIKTSEKGKGQNANSVADFHHGEKSLSDNSLKSLKLLCGVGLQGIHGFLQHLFLIIFNFFMQAIVCSVIY